MIAMKQPHWVLWAWRELGVRETPGSNANPRIRAMFKDAGHEAIVKDEVAWCAAFVGACLERGGVKSTRSLMARSYTSWGRESPAMRYGAIAVFSRGKNQALGHVGFVVGETDDHIQLLGGNQAGQVSVQAYPKSRLIGLRWPEGIAIETDVAAGEAGQKARAGTPRNATTDVFELALGHVLEMEGGFTDDPHDPGGPTNRGITLAVFARWIGESVSERNRAGLVKRLKGISPAMVREIYQTRYWQPAGCDAMVPALALMHFDASVNHGVGGAIRMLQHVVGAAVDGEIGPETRGRIAAMPLRELLLAYAEARRERYRNLDHFWRFGKGWLRRVDATLAEASALLLREQSRSSKGSGPKKAERVSPSSEEGKRTMDNYDRSESTSQPKWWGESLTIWGVIVTGISTVLPVVGPLIGIDITADAIKLLGEQVVQIVQAVGGLVGTLMAIYGRARATTPIERRLMAVKL